MSVAAPPIQAVHHKLARHYLNELQTAGAAFRRGHDHSAYGLALFDSEWAQIKHWQAWSAARLDRDPDSAWLCALYPQAGEELLALRQTPQERIAWLQAGRHAARSIGNQRAEVACLFLLAWAHHKQAATERAEATGREALALAETIGEDVYAARSLHLLGEITVRRGDFDEAQQLHTRSLDLLRVAGDRAHLAEVYFSLSELAYLQGNFSSSRAFAEQSHTLHLALGLSPTTNNNLTWLGLLTAETGDLDAGERYVRRSIELCRATGARGTLAHGLYILSQFMLLRTNYAEALASLAESLQLAQSIGEAWLIPYILIQRADTHSGLGDLAAAQRDIDQVVETARQTGYRLTLSTGLVHQAKVQLQLGRIQETRDALREGLELAVSTQMTIDQVHGVLIAARLWRQLGHPGQAVEWAGLLQSRPGVEATLRREISTLCAALEAEMGRDAFAAALKRGQALKLHDAVAEILRAVTTIGARPIARDIP